MEKKLKTKLEGGITLISLIVIIVLMIILAAVTVRGITGHEGILDSSAEITNTYMVEQYREQVQELAREIILKDSILRKRNNTRKYGRRNARRRLDKNSSSKL